jgi:hypothetical protein
MTTRKEQTLNDIIRSSIDDALPSEWSRAAINNYTNQATKVTSAMVDPFTEETISSIKLTDEIEKPAHYNYGKYETIDVIVDTLGKYEAINYCHGNVLKYIIRMWHKGTPEKDLRKAIWYSNKMLELLGETKGVHW